MSNYAVIDASGNVVNVVVLMDGAEWAPPEGQTVVQSDVAAIGWTYVDGVFTAPVAPALPPLTVAQQILMLEATQTTRRVREAAIGIDGGWLKNLDDEINALRSTIPKT